MPLTIEEQLTTLLDVLKPARRTIICDVGANPVGKSPYQTLLDVGACEVWGCEPQPQAYEKLRKMEAEHEHYINTAIGDGEEHTLHICQADGFTSLLEPSEETIDLLKRWKKHMAVVDRIPLKTATLDSLDELPSPDLLKIDVQGAELSVFQNGVTKLAQTNVIITEVAFIPL